MRHIASRRAHSAGLLIRKAVRGKIDKPELDEPTAEALADEPAHFALARPAKPEPRQAPFQEGDAGVAHRNTKRQSVSRFVTAGTL